MYTNTNDSCGESSLSMREKGERDEEREQKALQRDGDAEPRGENDR